MNGRTIRRRALGALAAAGLTVLCTPAPALAQVDVRMIRPNVLLLLDTSGSMEWRNNVPNSSCIGADGGPCNRCSNGASICAPSCPADERRNRWTTAIEVLTGTIENFSCVERTRNDPLIYDYDLNYPIPYHEPLSNGVPLWATGARQLPDGVLDTYRERVRFGLMTFDNDYCVGLTATYGQFSYGPNRQFRANGCMDTPVDINIGARRPSTDETTDPVPGGLISVGPPLADSAELIAINERIQTTIIGRQNPPPLPPQRGIRPYGGTPIAAMLDDALYYWTNHPDVIDGSTGTGRGDPYFRCRARYNILITDGKPNMDFRPMCEGGTGICPYATPDQTALAMATEGAGLPGAKTFVIAFNASDPEARAALEPIAINGGTMNVLYANDRAGLQSALSAVLDRIASQTSTRTAPTFGMSVSGGTSSTLYQFQSSFAVASGYPWEGVLERRRSECQGSPPVPVDQDIDPRRDDFGLLLRYSERLSRGWGPRKLWTYVPPTARDVDSMRQTIQYTTGTPPRRTLDGTIPPALFGVSTTTERDALFAWLRGDPSDRYRRDRPLGDIFHSNPLFVGPPDIPLPDQTFSAYRQRDLRVGGWRTVARKIGTREPVVYVGTNDGILHAFHAETGEEIWGFVPPYLTGSIRSMYPATHQYGVDGSPVVREVVFQRSARSLGDANSWHTVLVVGLRGGGGAYVALDVTDPYDPKFLWQFTDRNLVNAYGIPAIATVFTSWGSTSPQERAVAILPGGAGSPVTPCTPTQNPRPPRTDLRITNVSPYGVPRPFVRCWNRQEGQHLYVVDLETGQLIRDFGPTGSPLVGSPALHLGTVGAVSTRAYVGDADGGVWRLDMSDPNPANWQFALAFDVFYDAAYNEGQPIVAPPVVSVDRNGNTLIAVGTGDPDLLEGFDRNRIAVYREELQTAPDGRVAGIRVSNHWEMRVNSDVTQGLYPGERLTGTMSLFNGVLYFGTFVPANSTDACQMGFSRLWGVDQENAPGGVPAPRLDVDGDPATPDEVRVTRDLNGNGTTDDDVNSVLFGVGIVRRPTCVTTSTTIDPYFGGTREWVEGINGGDFRLVAQTGRGGVASGGSRTTVISRRLPTPTVESRINAWAVVFE